MVGHGVRRRQVCGPAEPGEQPRVHVLEVRRYRCRECRRTVTVVPRGVIGRRHYSAGAVALACWLWSFGQLPLGEVRRRVAPGRSDEPGWATLGRWLRAVDGGRLFQCVRRWPAGFLPRQRAERVAATVMALGPGADGSAAARLFAGAALAA